MCVGISISISISIYLYLSLSLSLSLSIYIYIYMCTRIYIYIYVCVYIYIYIYIYSDRNCGWGLKLHPRRAEPVRCKARRGSAQADDLGIRQETIFLPPRFIISHLLLAAPLPFTTGTFRAPLLGPP